MQKSNTYIYLETILASFTHESILQKNIDDEADPGADPEICERGGRSLLFSSSSPLSPFPLRSRAP